MSRMEGKGCNNSFIHNSVYCYSDKVKHRVRQGVHYCFSSSSKRKKTQSRRSEKSCRYLFNNLYTIPCLQYLDLIKQFFCTEKKNVGRNKQTLWFLKAKRGSICKDQMLFPSVFPVITSLLTSLSVKRQPNRKLYSLLI
jgi:hypothetical protein